jgi:hypothetical protein
MLRSYRDVSCATSAFSLKKIKFPFEMQYNLRNETNIKNNGGNKWLKALE